MAIADKLPLAELALTGRRVLVVEDEYFLADDIARALTAAGAEILGPVGDIDEALRLLGEHGLDGAVLDINLRGTAIYPFAGELTRRGIPFVFATGYDGAAVPERYRDVPVWEKPFDPGALVRALPALMTLRDG